jgi:hypothetical protein
MMVMLGMLLLVVILGVVGIAVRVIWGIALIVLIFWLLGFVFRGVDPVSGGPRHRWYRW